MKNHQLLELLLSRRSCHEDVHLKNRKNVKTQFLLKSAMYARRGNGSLTYEYTFDQKYGSLRLNPLYLDISTHPNVHPMKLYLNKHPKRLPTKHQNLFLVDSQQTPYIFDPSPHHHQPICLLQSCPMNINLNQP